jgi:hypothetical protein
MATKQSRRPIQDSTIGISLNGQWLGRYTGSAPGFLMVNLDDREDHFEGTAFITPDSAPPVFIPTTVAFIKTPDKAMTLAMNKLQLYAFNPRTNLIDTVENVRAIAQGVDLPRVADVKGELRDDGLFLNWTTDFGLQGSAVLPRSLASMPSEYQPMKFSWKQFKAYFSKLQGHSHIFRGQSTRARLRSRFHRTGRADLSSFIKEDIATLHKRLSARTRHVFRLEVPDENGAFFNLVQHHGYPTPLLDWTHSPYVAAFFAYRKITSARARSAKRNEKVRIFVFDKEKWHEDYNQVFLANGPLPHLTIAEFIAIDDERMVPQQAVSSITNIDDIESYVRSKEVELIFP